MLAFIPQPKKINKSTGRYSLPRKATIGVCGYELFPAAQEVCDILGGGEISIIVAGVSYDVTLCMDMSTKPAGYELAIDSAGVSIGGWDAQAVFHGVQTLGQIVQQSPKGELPKLTIDDWPDFADRGVYYDLARGRVPTLVSLKQQAELLSKCKINQLQLYIEHTFAYRRHPDIGKGNGALSAADIMELDAFCRERHVELLPSLSSFGHLQSVLHHKQYRHMAEMGHEKGNYWSLSPANPDTYKFLQELFDEFLPCFSSDRFNVCCDEVWDLGQGQSAKLAKKMGKGRLYLSHIKKLRDIAAGHGKRILIWGDIVREYPELIPEIPKDITLLDWGYDRKMDWNRVKDFTDTGLPTYVCPSVNGYGCLFPRMWESAANIVGWAKAGKKVGAVGMLNTDWGDGGHFNFMEFTWPGYLLGAEQSWNVNADVKSFWRRFCKLFLKIEDKVFVDAFMELGDLAQPGFWCRLLLWADGGDTMFEPHKSKISWGRSGTIIEKNQAIVAADGVRCAKRFRAIGKVFATYAAKRGMDPHGILPYWLHAVDTMAVAADKLAMFGHGGTDTPAKRKTLKANYSKIAKRFEKLWMARNRRSEIKFTLGYLRDRAKVL